MTSSPEQLTHLVIPGIWPEVLRVGYGTYHLGDKLNAPDAIDSLAGAFQAGVNLFDTSDNYGTELVIGRAVSGGYLPREEVIIATKTGLATTLVEQKVWNSEYRPYNTDPARIRKQVDRSLMVLGDEVGYIDLYQLHVYDPHVEPVAHAELMAELMEAGKIKAWGVSNYSIQELSGLLHACDSHGLPRPSTTQPFYNLLASDTEDAAQFAAEQGLIVLAHSPLVKGVLTDKRLPELSKIIDRAIETTPEENRHLADGAKSALDKLVGLSKLSKLYRTSLAKVAIGWTLQDPNVVSLAAVTTPDYLEDACQALTEDIDPEILASIEALRADKEALQVFLNISHSVIRNIRKY